MVVNTKEFKDAVKWITSGNKIRKNQGALVFSDGRIVGNYAAPYSNTLCLSQKLYEGNFKGMIKGISVPRLKKSLSFFKTKTLVIDCSETEFIISDENGHEFKDTLIKSDWTVFNGINGLSDEVEQEGIKDFSEILAKGKQIVPFASLDHFREFMQGVYIDIKENCMVTTDGKRLGKISADVSGLPEKMIVPTDFFKKAEGMSRCSWRKGSWLSIDDGRRSVSVRLIDGNYPNYPRVIPDTKDFAVQTADRETLKAAAEYSMTLGSPSNRTLLSEGKFGTEYLSEGDTSIPAYFNAQFILDGMKALKSEMVKIAINPNKLDEGFSTNAATMTDGELLYVVMPMNIAS